MGRVYAVASGKGGVGKTATTASLGAALAAAGHGTVVVDADLGMANLGSALGVADDGPTLHDVLAGEATVADAVREAPDRPAVLPGSRDLDAFAAARPEGLSGVLDELADEYEHVVVDTGAGLSTDSLAPLRAADEVVLVSTPDPAALDDTERTATVTRRLGTPLRGLVVVRARGDRIDRARERFGGEVLGTVPDDSAVVDAMEAGVPIAESAPRSPATGAYRRLAATLTGVEVPGDTETSDDEGATGGIDRDAADGAETADGSDATAGDASGVDLDAPAAARPADLVEEAEADAAPDEAADVDADGDPEDAEAGGNAAPEVETVTDGETVTDSEPDGEPVEEGSDDGPDTVGSAGEPGDAADGDGEEGDVADDRTERPDEATADAEGESGGDGEPKGFLSRLFG